MWGVELNRSEPFVYSLFGIQYEEPAPSGTQGALIHAFDALITSSGAHLERLTQDGPFDLKTQTWLAYWPSMTAFNGWWRAATMVEFWHRLPPDAGMWREVIQVPACRTQFGTNKEQLNGTANVGTLVPNTDTILYWGCYRDRIGEVTRENRLDSPLAMAPRRGVAGSRGGDGENEGADGRREADADARGGVGDAGPGVREVGEAGAEAGAAGEAGEAGREAARPGPYRIRRGRTRVNKFPDHLCFVVEGQDHSAIAADEKQHWLEHFDGLTTRWMADLVAAGPEAGVLDARLCYDEHVGTYHDPPPSSAPTPSPTPTTTTPPTSPPLPPPPPPHRRSRPAVPNYHYNRKIQLFWFLDLRALERIGRFNKGHVELRSKFLKAYCPAGPMKAGNLVLWVETSILKANELDCEYIGCVEGTGFLAYDHDAAFGSIYVE